MQRSLLGLALCGLAYWYYLDSRGPLRAPGVLAPDAPVQAAPPPGLKPFTLRDVRVTPVESIALTARVIGTQRYFSGREAGLSPLDVVLGWGRLSDSGVLSRVDFAQSARRYEWRVYDPALDAGYVRTHSANMHMIPADAAIDAALKGLRPGHVVTLKGYLVEVRAADGWSWTGSLVRDDAHGGTLVWVEHLDVH